MADKIAYEDYVALSCRRKGMTRAALFAWLQETGRVIRPCNCSDYSECRGWACVWPDEDAEEKAQ